ncbi:MAG: hypothetical protein HC859_09065 [Bacteroidia bacterium]|nr:hypothetical protein [Bacteroidia bacterium]
MHHDVEIIILLLAVVTALAEVTDRIRIPYPILLVFAGIAIGLVPGLPEVSLNPETVFLIFLPPILYAAALDNVVMTPHMSGWTSGTVLRRQQTMADNITRLATGRPLINVLKPPSN